MDDYVLHYQLKGRVSLDADWYVIGVCSDKESLDEMIEKYKKTWRYVVWDSYRSAKIKRKK